MFFWSLDSYWILTSSNDELSLNMMIKEEEVKLWSFLIHGLSRTDLKLRKQFFLYKKPELSPKRCCCSLRSEWHNIFPPNYAIVSICYIVKCSFNSTAITKHKHPLESVCGDEKKSIAATNTNMKSSHFPSRFVSMHQGERCGRNLTKVKKKLVWLSSWVGKRAARAWEEKWLFLSLVRRAITCFRNTSACVRHSSGIFPLLLSTQTPRWLTILNMTTI